MKKTPLSYTLFGCIALIAMVALIGCQRSGNESSEVLSDVDDTPKSERSDVTSDQIVEGQPDAGEDQQHDHETAEHGPPIGHGPGMGRGRGMGHRMGRGPGAMSGRRADMTTIHAMFADQEKINRTVKLLPNGAEAITESDDIVIASLLQEHVPSMESRVLENNPLPPMTFHPVFVELIKHSEDYTLEYEDTEQGVKVTYHAEDPFVVMLVQEHAKLVSRFIKNGMSEIHKPYTLPIPQSPDTNRSPIRKRSK